jgi:L-fucose isomerase-like protein
VVGAAAASTIRGARLGLLGGIVPGYGDVVLDEGPARSLGLELVALDRDAIARAEAATDDRSDRDGDGLPEAMALEDAARPLLARSLRVHAMLRRLADDAGLDAIALNCHSDVLRWSDSLGIVSCLASTLLWSAGMPVACTGDAVTAVALMMASRIAGSAQYCEGYAVESDTGELLVSSCGMADLRLLPPGARARVCPNELYPGRHGLGLATRFDFAPGPATIAAFAPATGGRPSRLVAAAGELRARGFQHLNGPSGMFGFDRPGRGIAGQAWIDAAPAHHLALVQGDRRPELSAASRFLGVEFVDVGPAGGG